MFSWERLWEYFPDIMAKFPVTLRIVLVAFGTGLLLGCLLAAIRIKKIPVLSQVVAVFLSYIRCTPVICQMFVIYFGTPVLLGAIGIDTSEIDSVVYVLVAYGLNMSGFIGETIRSSVLAVPVGQVEAGQACGLTGLQTLWQITAPQAFRIALPMLGTTFVSLFQATALAYMVGVVDMMGKAASLGNRTGHPLEGYIACAIVFAVISIVLEQVFMRISRHLDFDNKRMKKRVEKEVVKEVEVSCSI
ncbi:amino acid ABC transporter permease [Scatolibacter rhodanostii]|uniref:amino acid ABC transporter permease n=1 Tax=Scatolibacter rhodanostii TaxID=2014781 RepID=UPI000C077B91|nr:amino acid ABC transporter permease [Scatolibacter rhodanostii]